MRYPDPLGDVARGTEASTAELGLDSSCNARALSSSDPGPNEHLSLHSLRLQIAQSRSSLYTLGPKVGIIYILEALGFLEGADTVIIEELGLKDHIYHAFGDRSP